MSLSLATRRRTQTSSTASINKWTSSSYQHNSKSSGDILKQYQPPANLHAIRKQKSFIETNKLINSYTQNIAGRNYLSRGLSVGRSNDYNASKSSQRAPPYSKTPLRKYSSIQFTKEHTESTSLYQKKPLGTTNNTGVVNANVRNGAALSRNSRQNSIQAWSSNTSIVKSLDKESAAQSSNSSKLKDNSRTDSVDTITKGKSKIEANNSTNSSQSIKKSLTATAFSANSKTLEQSSNKVNLSIVLSHALNSDRDGNDEYNPLSENDEADDDYDDDDDDNGNGNYAKENRNVISNKIQQDLKRTDSLSSKPTTNSTAVSAQQRRALYHSSRLQSGNSTAVNNISIHNSNQANATNSNVTTATGPANNSPTNNETYSPCLTVQKRPPLQRAMSAPVRSFDENTKNGAFLASKRKSRRRKLTARNICSEKSPPSAFLGSQPDIQFDTKSNGNKKTLARSKSVAADVITLVSLISSEGSDSEKEDSSTTTNSNTTPSNSDSNSPNRRAPSLRKTGKSVSFQENYPPTFQFASKEYSHMLRRGSIAPLAARIKNNRPPTAPAGSIFHKTVSNVKDLQDENQMENFNSTATNAAKSKPPTATAMVIQKPVVEEEHYDYPEYVRSPKERECWKLYMKMSAKGVSITYDTILRGMLTPTEFRQLQKQRELEEAKAKEAQEAEDDGTVKVKGPTTAIERLSESLLKK